MVASASVRWDIRRVRISDGRVDTESQTISARTEVLIGQNYYSNPDFDYIGLGCVMGSANELSGPFMIVCQGGIVGAAYVPYPFPAQGSPVDGNFFTTYEPTYERYLRTFDELPDGLDDISKNGQYYKDDSGNWRNIDDDVIVATAQQVSNLPNDVDFNGWLIDDEVIKGSDGNYYHVNGSQMFQNLPDGVIPSHTSVEDIYSGDDGNYYDPNGDPVLQNLPEGVTPQSRIGNIIVGSDGNYYDINGSRVMGNLPSGVSIVSYDPVSGNYIGSDGNRYDINGNPVSAPCSGTSLSQNNTVRLVIDGLDIFGNQVNLGADIVIGQSGINTQAIGGFSSIRKINRIICRNLDNISCVGTGQLKINGLVVGARIGLDVEGFDIDTVLGNYNVATCVFSPCEKYATVVLNDNLPLGLTPNTQTIDVGYYVLNSDISFEWSGFIDDFPICCGDYSDDEISSGSTSDTNSGDLSEIVDKLDDLISAVKELSTIVEVVVSPSEDVNIYRKRWHYNDGSDLDNLSGFSE